MKTLVIDFNDSLYRETGAGKNTLRMREEQIASDDGRLFLLQVVKKNTGVSENLYVTVKDDTGKHVEDICIQMAGKTFKIDAGKSLDAVVLENFSEDNLNSVEISSEKEKINVSFSVRLENPDRIAEHIEKIVEAYRRADKQQEAAECGLAEKAIAYALNEIPDHEIPEVRKHIFKCRDCFKLVIDVRASEAEEMESVEKLIFMALLVMQQVSREAYQRFIQSMLFLKLISGRPAASRNPFLKDEKLLPDDVSLVIVPWQMKTKDGQAVPLFDRQFCEQADNPLVKKACEIYDYAQEQDFSYFICFLGPDHDIMEKTAPAKLPPKGVPLQVKAPAQVSSALVVIGYDDWLQQQWDMIESGSFDDKIRTYFILFVPENNG